MTIRQLLSSAVGLWKRRVSCAFQGFPKVPQTEIPAKTRPPTSQEWSAYKNKVGPHPLIHCRFVESTTCGMGVSTRSQRWGVIRAVDIGRTERGLVYDGHQSQEMREWNKKRGQDTWVLVHYDDGRATYEPLWDCSYPTMYQGPNYGKDFYVERHI